VRYDKTGKWLLIGRYWVRLSDGFRLPVIQGGTTPVTVQVTHRWVADDEDLTTATLLGAGNGEDITLETGVDNRVRIRIRVEETAGGNFVLTGNLYCSYEGGTYQDISTTSDYVRAISSKNTTWTITDEDDILANRLGAGNGVWEDGKYDDNGVVESVIGLKSEHTEIEFCLYVDDATVNDGDTIDLRIYDSVSELTSYTDTPRINVSKAVSDPAPSVSDGITVGESTSAALGDLAVSVSDGITIADTVIDVDVIIPTTDLDIDVSDSIITLDDISADAIGKVTFEKGDKSEFDSITDPDSDLTVSGTAAMVGSYGLEVLIDDTNPCYGSLDNISLSGYYYGSFRIDPNTLTMGDEDGLGIFRTTVAGASAYLVNISLIKSSGTYRLNVETREDDLTIHGSGWKVISDQPTKLEWLLKEGTGDGWFKVWIDDSLEYTVGSLDNDTAFADVDDVYFGHWIGADYPTTQGTFYLDHLIIGESDTDSPLVGLGDLVISVSDGLTVGDTPTVIREGDYSISVSDGITVGESTSAVLDDETISVSDGIAVGEANIDLDIGALAAREIDVSDGITIGETTSATLDDHALDISDGITFGEAISRLLVNLVGVSDGLTLGEVIYRILVSFVDVSDDITVGESVNALLVSDIDVSDDITIGENVTTTLDDLALDISDGLTVGDSATVIRPIEGEHNVNVSDGITIGESTAAEHDDETASVSDDVTIGENVTASLPDLTLSISDNLTVGESGENVAVAISTSAISVTDNITVGESVTTSLDDMAVALTDNVTVADAVTVQRVDVSADLDVSVVSGLALGESVEMYQFAAIVESWTLKPPGLWRIDEIRNHLC
jgi:hypothetical protein